MRLTSLRLDDFGCFRNARLEDLSSDLVVVGGPQRAGKTTLMQALRQFPAGVSRGADLPPPTDAYRVDAEMTHEGHDYRYVLEGHAAPTVSPLGDGPALTADEVFGPVTARQYAQLYTISLDELRRLPPGLDDTDALATVLLGGAYGDIAEIPDLQERFRKRAHDVGLKRGNPEATTTDLHDPYRRIREGIEARRRAGDQVDEHDAVTTDLRATRMEKARVERDLEAHRLKRDRLIVLREIYEPVRRLDALEADLAEADVAAAERFPTHLADRLAHFESELDAASKALTEAERTFRTDATLTTDDAYREWLLEHADEISRFAAQRERWADTAGDLAETHRTLAEREATLEREVEALHPDWDGSFAQVAAVETTAVDTARVRELAERVRECRSECDRLTDETTSLEARLDSLRVDLSELTDEADTETSVTLPKTKPLVVALTALAAGIGAGTVTSPVVGGLLGLGIVVVGMYLVDSTVTVDPPADTAPRRELRSQISTLESDLDATRERLAAAEADREAAESELGTLASDLGLPTTLPASDVFEFYETVSDLQERIDDYEREREAWADDRVALAADLRPVAELLAAVTEPSWSAAAPLEDVDALLSTVEALDGDLDLALDVRDARVAREDCIDDVDSVLTEWSADRSVTAATPTETVRKRIEAFHDRAAEAAETTEAADERDRLRSQVRTRVAADSTRETFEALRAADEPWVEVAATAARAYADEEAIADDRQAVERRIEDLQDRRDSLHDECLELEAERDGLASEDDLRAAQAEIDAARVDFERVGEAYAVDRLAEKLVGRLHERLMAAVVGSLVDEASAIFERITGEYEGIELAGDPQDLTFRALRAEGGHHGVGELSRATAEQLFLAVRLARIRETGVELPVVLDDAATNFDPAHAARVFDVVGELAGTTQVFFLTCHPEFVGLTTGAAPATQYWSLAEGKFTRVAEAAGLERRLQAD